jgi:hypothetical protein
MKFILKNSVAVFSLGLVLSFGLIGCDLTELNKASDDAVQPKTEATVLGVWRASIPVTPITNPPTRTKATMVINADHTMLLSHQVPTGQPEPLANIEQSIENFSWTVSEGKLFSIKTACLYKDPVTGEPTGETVCRAPISDSTDIDVKGIAWTMVKQTETIIFRKDK